MNCAAVRKFLHALADGQLADKAKAHVLDHVKTCSACSRLVDEHRELRAALGRQIEAVPVPGGLEDRVRQAITTDQSAPRPHRWRTVLRVRTYVAAACIVFASLAVWRFALPAESAVRVGPGEGATSAVVKTHNMCCDHAASHHNADLPKDLTALASAISDRHHRMITVLAPDLSRYGFAFESANFCGVKEGDGCNGGGHLLYARSDNNLTTRLSVFSVPRWDLLDGDEPAPDGEGMRRFSVAQAAGPDISVVVWHEDATSFICCAEVGADAMADLANDVRVALHDSMPRRMLAMLRPHP
jgi:anti-sigma factor RsiW